MIRLYLKIPEEFVNLIFQDRFWVLHIPYVRKFKLQFLAQLPVDHLAHPVVSSLTLFSVLIFCICLYDWSFRLCHHIIYICYFLHLIYFCFDIVGPYGVILCCNLKRFSFFLKFSIFQPLPSFLVRNVTCLSLIMSMQLFFLPISFFCVILFCWYSCCQYCFWWL